MPRASEAPQETMGAVAPPSMVRCHACAGVGVFDAKLNIRLRVKGVRLRGKTGEAFFCLIRFGTLVCYTAVCFS